MTSPIDPSIMKRALEAIKGRYAPGYLDKLAADVAYEIIEAERRGMERAAEIANGYAASFEDAMPMYGEADKDAGRGRQEGHVKAGKDIAAAILAAYPQPKEGE